MAGSDSEQEDEDEEPLQSKIDRMTVNSKQDSASESDDKDISFNLPSTTNNNNQSDHEMMKHHIRMQSFHVKDFDGDQDDYFALELHLHNWRKRMFSTMMNYYHCFWLMSREKLRDH
jgi:hypothetical protein